MLKRLSLSAALVAVVALTATACSSSDADGGAAAVVNGVEITQESVYDELALMEENPVYAQFWGVGEVAGTGPNSFSTEAAAVVLDQSILREVALGLLADGEVEVTEEHRTFAAEQLGIGVPADPNAGASPFASASPEIQDRMVNLVAPLVALSDLSESGTTEITDAEVEAVYNENPEAYAEACASHILFTTDTRTEEEAVALANEAKVRLDAGEDFATLATELSEDPGSAPGGGDLSCNPKGAFVPAFDDVVWSTEVGVVTEPVVSEFGAHVILVSERNEPTFEEAADQVRAQLEGEAVAAEQQAAQEFLVELVEGALVAADVTVNAKFGTWEYLITDETGQQVPTDNKDEATSAGVVPPEGPAQPSTTLPPLDLGGLDPESLDLEELNLDDLEGLDLEGGDPGTLNAPPTTLEPLPGE